MRSLRLRTEESSNYKLESVEAFASNHMIGDFIAIMLIGMVLSMASLGVVIYQIIVN